MIRDSISILYYVVTLIPRIHILCQYSNSLWLVHFGIPWLSWWQMSVLKLKGNITWFIFLQIFLLLGVHCQATLIIFKRQCAWRENVLTSKFIKRKELLFHSRYKKIIKRIRFPHCRFWIILLWARYRLDSLFYNYHFVI